jgi:hypothetical protein
MGSKDEISGNQLCSARLQEDGTFTLCRKAGVQSPKANLQSFLVMSTHIAMT